MGLFIDLNLNFILIFSCLLAGDLTAETSQLLWDAYIVNSGKIFINISLYREARQFKHVFHFKNTHAFKKNTLS